MKHRGLAGLVASNVALLMTLGFACVDADIPNVSNRLRDALAENFANAGAPPLDDAGDGGSASTPNAGAGGGGGAAGGDEPGPDPDENGGAAGSSMAGGAGSGGEGAAGSPPVTGDDCDGFGLVQQYCGSANCHGTPDGAFGGFASSEAAARDFIGEESALACAGQGDIIDPENPSDSLLVTKLSADPPCGSQMPQNGDPLTPDEVACIEEWISGL
jgi:hypothetical protein